MTAPDAERNATAADVADYIGVIATELRGLAAKADLGFLAFLLAMVADDAAATAREHATSKAKNT